MGSRVLRWFNTAFMLGLATLCALLALDAHLKLADARQLVATGTAIEGTVSEVDRVQRAISSRMSYIYTVASGTYTRLNQAVPYTEVEKLKRGGPVKVWLDLSNPQRAITTAEIAEHESVMNQIFFPLASLALFAWAIARILGTPRPQDGSFAGGGSPNTSRYPT